VKQLLVVYGVDQAIKERKDKLKHSLLKLVLDLTSKGRRRETAIGSMM
jgi:hypothetical protein